MELMKASLYVFFYTLLIPLVILFHFRRSRRLPPEPRGARPILGHLHLMGGGATHADLPHVKLTALADEYGPLFTIRLGVRHAVVVSSWKLARELFTTHDAAILSRPKLRASRHLSYDFAMFGFSPYGAYWRELRKLVSTQLLSSRRVEQMSHVCISEITDSINWLHEHWEEQKDESGRALVDMKKWFGDLNMNVILLMVAGKRISGETRRWREVMREFFRLAGTFVLADALPYLWWLDLGGQEKKMKETAKELDGIMEEWLEEHRRRRESGRDEARDFMDVMLSALRGGGAGAAFQGQHDADTIIKSTCEAVILGGTDTTSIMLIWALALLLNHRHVLRKIQQELDEHIGRERRVIGSDINNLIYLQAVVKETLRLYPVSPIGLVREFTKDCNVGDYRIPKGTWLIVNLWRLQRDPNVWTDQPLEFIPERFLIKHRDVHVKGQDFELIPFGAGRRICPGMNLALLMLHLVLANFLQAFDVMTVPDEVVDMMGSAGMTNAKATSLDVLVAPRFPSYP